VALTQELTLYLMQQDDVESRIQLFQNPHFLESLHFLIFGWFEFNPTVLPSGLQPMTPTMAY
jgi:hypothetical protein